MMSEKMNLSSQEYGSHDGEHIDDMRAWLEQLDELSDEKKIHLFAKHNTRGKLEELLGRAGMSKEAMQVYSVLGLNDLIQLVVTRGYDVSAIHVSPIAPDYLT